MRLELLDRKSDYEWQVEPHGNMRVPGVIYGVVTLIFTRVLYVGLPTGYWPGFYDFGNWFVVLLRS